MWVRDKHSCSPRTRVFLGVKLRDGESGLLGTGVGRGSGGLGVVAASVFSSRSVISVQAENKVRDRLSRRLCKSRTALATPHFGQSYLLSDPMTNTSSTASSRIHLPLWPESSSGERWVRTCASAASAQSPLGVWSSRSQRHHNPCRKVQSFCEFA